MVKGNTATQQSLQTQFGSLFKGSVSNSMSCKGMPTSSMMESFSVLGLVLSGRREHITDALKRYFEPEILPDYQTDRGKVQAKKQPHFVDVPKVRIAMFCASATFQRLLLAFCSTVISKPTCIYARKFASWTAQLQQPRPAATFSVSKTASVLGRIALLGSQVLIVHLQRFEYPGLKPVKVNADVVFDKELELLPSMFAHSAPRKRARYGLIATVIHHGAQLVLWSEKTSADPGKSLKPRRCVLQGCVSPRDQTLGEHAPVVR